MLMLKFYICIEARNAFFITKMTVFQNIFQDHKFINILNSISFSNKKVEDDILNVNCGSGFRASLIIALNHRFFIYFFKLIIY